MASLDEKWEAVDNFKSIVVDRERDVVRVTKELYDLHSNREQLRGVTSSCNYRLTIPFAPHLFGSGKTTFARTYLELVQRFGETFLSKFASDPSRRAFLENLKKASLLYVDLKELEPTVPIEFFRNLKWAVYYLLYRSACNQMGLPFMKPDEAYRHIPPYPSFLIAELRKTLGIPSDQYLLLAIDEVGVFDTKATFFELEKNDKGVVRPYNDFFGIISQLCKEPDLFFIVVGKSKGLSINNDVAFGLSRVILHFISLSPLDASSIVEFLQKSLLETPTQVPVCNVLCSSSFSVNELADSLLECTGGVPGLLTRLVNMLLNYVVMRNKPFISKEECLTCMNDYDFRRICAEPFVERILNLDEDRRSVFDLLLMMALYRIPSKVDDRLTSESFLYDAVTEMGLYRYPIDENTFQVLIPKVFVVIFKNDPSISSLEKILLGSLDVEPVDCFFYSKCRVFEGIVALRLVLMLSSKNRNELRDLLCQLSPIWKQMKLPISTISPIHYIKSVVSSRETRSESNKSRRTFANTEWNKIIRETLYLETIYIPLDATSHSPDIIFQLQSPVEPKVLTVGVACKGRWKSEGIGWSDIIDEAKKFLDPVYDQVLSSAMDYHHCMLIIVSTKLSLNVSNELGNQSRCYSSGMFIGNDSFKVPDNCELVILCERDVQMLIDDEILNGLERAFHVSHNPTFWDFGLDLLDRIRNSFLSWQ
ncbi:archaeal ATPase [Galdieria sulphuraria]|uniref:Archaeal ATPase n=1 Tax=Galdieria sulphuraria TaxID=130081 RepID=M2XQK2_GALSU|nr:archaeal ATPase [Galdieria sulphuraria]EME25883.1 archaeal ATPase [Galdieria sulphuraria]|eukprot:XP_005702403.1 archaeal ATPase [Galdieria sulphuraria]